MTYPIPAGSLKADRAIKFGRELEKAMKTRGVGARTIQDATGMSRAAIRSWRDGRNLPRLDTAAKLGAALDWPRLEELGRTLRTKTCPIDQRTFVDESGSDNRVYCSPSCQRVDEKVRLECALRPVSPLPLAEARIDVDVVKAKPHNGYRKPGADRDRSLATWARYTPEERAARIAKTAHASKVARGVVPA